jgi:hypothetical protein
VTTSCTCNLETIKSGGFTMRDGIAYCNSCLKPEVTSSPLPKNDLADKVQSLKITNSVIRALSILGGLILIVVGMEGECVEDCSGGYFSTPVMEPSIELVALGVTSLLFSTLIAQIVSLFATHVEASHKA